MAEYKVASIPTSVGKRYIILRKRGKDYSVLQYGKEYKTKAGALREIKRRIRLDI
ncbi:MAG: hypothetical protein ACOCV1_01590 [Bacillota bacterium]